jgi:hypothetical protein
MIFEDIFFVVLTVFSVREGKLYTPSLYYVPLCLEVEVRKNQWRHLAVGEVRKGERWRSKWVQ